MAGTAPDAKANVLDLTYTLTPTADLTLTRWAFSGFCVRTLGKDDDHVITSDKKRGVRQFFWQPDSQHILYRQDQDGDGQALQHARASDSPCSAPSHSRDAHANNRT